MAKKTMIASRMTDGQIRNLTMKFRDALRKHRDEFTTDASQHVCGVENIGMEFVATVRKHAEAKMLLAPRGTTMVTLDEGHVPQVYYQTRSGLWVSDNFRKLVVSRAQMTKAGATFTINRFDLVRDLSDEQVEQALPGKHLFNETSVCAVIASITAQQPSGEGKPWYLLYLGSCVVGVRWFAGRREWYVCTWLRDSDRWGAGDQVLSPATES